MRIDKLHNGLFAALLVPAAVSAGEFPLWEAGLGLSVFSLPHYRGSSESKLWALPFPHIVYRGDRLKIDRQSMKGIFLKRDRHEMDLSFAVSPPVDSDENEARAGMDDLMPTLESGLSWKYRLWQNESGDRRVRLVLPVRAVVATDLAAADWAGWVTVPAIAFDSGITDPHAWKLGASVGVQWADARNNGYFYTVSEADATPGRAAYRAGAGYGGANLIFSASRRFGSWWFGTFVRYDNVQGASFEGSPLVTARHNVWAGFGVSKILMQSNATVKRDD